MFDHFNNINSKSYSLAKQKYITTLIIHLSKPGAFK